MTTKPARRATRRPSRKSGGDPVLLLRQQAMQSIAVHLLASPGTQGEKAAALDISRPRLNALLKGRVELFGLDSLAQLALRAGLSVRLSIARRYVKQQ